MSPQVAAKNKWARIEARLRNRCFVEKYLDAFLAHLAVLANVVFPFGTYLMRKIAKVGAKPLRLSRKPSITQRPIPPLHSRQSLLVWKIA